MKIGNGVHSWSMVLGFFLVTSCGSQAPSFKEERTGGTVPKSDQSYPKTSPKDNRDDSGTDSNGENDVTGDDSSIVVEPTDGADDSSGGDGGDGDGSETTRRVEMAVTQMDASKVDILWVIDNSNSMKPLQNSLRANVGSFIEGLSVSGLDFQLGITSTDACLPSKASNLTDELCPDHYTKTAERGALVGERGKKVMYARDRDVVEKFQRLANLGINGSPFEHGLTSTKLAMERALRGDNEDFLRKDAFLAIVIVSDEEDDGVGLSMSNERGINYWTRNKTRYRFTSKDLVDYLKVVKPGNAFSVSSIVGTYNDQSELCESENGRAYELGSEYMTASKLTGGITESICEPDWSASLRRIADSVDSRIKSVLLESVPVAGSLEVQVDGIRVTTWSYNPARNIVQFSEVPAAGSQIAINYLTTEAK